MNIEKQMLCIGVHRLGTGITVLKRTDKNGHWDRDLNTNVVNKSPT